MIDADFRTHVAQFRLSAKIRAGGVTCVAGRNGAGKSTLLRALAGFLELDGGRIEVDGTDVSWLPPERRRMVVVTPGSFFSHLDVDRHLRWGARLTKNEPAERELSEIKSSLGINFGGPVGSLSLGMRERVALATALIARPKVVLVDEAFSNLHEREDFIASYGRLLTESKVDLIFSTQDEADGRLSDNLYRVAGGSVSAVPR